MKTMQWIAAGSMILTAWTGYAADGAAAMERVRRPESIEMQQVLRTIPPRRGVPAVASMTPPLVGATLEPVWVLVLAMFAGVALAGGWRKRKGMDREEK